MNSDEKKMMRRLIFCIGIISAIIFCCTHNADHESSAGNVSMGKEKININDIKLGVFIECVQSLERKMKSSNEQFKYEVSIQGTVEKIEFHDIYIKVENVSTVNLKKENEMWILDQSIVKKPPYDIGKTYAFRAKHDVIDNVVSTGLYEIYFLKPQ